MTWERVNGGKRPAWVALRSADKVSRSALELSALEDGTCLRFELPGGLQAVATKANARRWLLHGGGIDVAVLGDLPAVQMVRRDR